MKINKKLDEAISKVASLWPEDGELLASTDPVEFINRIYEEIVKLRATTTTVHVHCSVPANPIELPIVPLPSDSPKDEWDGVGPPPGCPCDWPKFGMAGACQCCHELWPRLKKAEAELSELKKNQ